MFATPDTSIAPSEYGPAESSVDENSRVGGCGPLKRLTVTFKNISITANEAGADYGNTFLSVLDPRSWLPQFGKPNQNKKVRSKKWSLCQS
jgi:hypothetical protein